MDLAIEIILLAAGDSSRLGRPKQTLPYKGTPLIAHAAKQAIQLGLQTTLVLGSNADKIKPLLTPSTAKIIINDNWQNGISSSIQCGLQNISSNTRAILLMLGDQPFIPQRHYQQLLEQYSIQPEYIIATRYKEGHIGVPAVIPDSFFSELRGLSGDKGAQKIIKNYSQSVIDIFCQQASFDIDTDEHVHWLKYGPPLTKYGQ